MVILYLMVTTSDVFGTTHSVYYRIKCKTLGGKTMFTSYKTKKVVDKLTTHSVYYRKKCKTLGGKTMFTSYKTKKIVDKLSTHSAYYSNHQIQYYCFPMLYITSTMAHAPITSIRTNTLQSMRSHTPSWSMSLRPIFFHTPGSHDPWNEPTSDGRKERTKQCYKGKNLCVCGGLFVC